MRGGGSGGGGGNGGTNEARWRKAPLTYTSPGERSRTRWMTPQLSGLESHQTVEIAVMPERVRMRAA